MSFSKAKEHLLSDFLFCVEKENIPSLGQYFSDCATNGGGTSPDDYYLLPITPTALGCLTTSSDCLTDGMIELRSNYKEYVTDELGGHTEKGWRELCVIGFNVLEGITLDIQALDRSPVHLEWVDSKLHSLDWGRVLISAVVDFGKYYKAKQVRLRPAHRCPPPEEIKSDPAKLDEFLIGLGQRHDDSARAFGFDYDKALDCFTLDL